MARASERCSEPDDRRPVPALTPLARTDLAHERMAGGIRSHGVPQRARTEPVDDRHPIEPRERRVVDVAAERLERLLHARATQVERCGDRPGAIEREPGEAGIAISDRLTSHGIADRAAA